MRRVVMLVVARLVAEVMWTCVSTILVVSVSVGIPSSVVLDAVV